MKRLCIVTGSRAEWGVLRTLAALAVKSAVFETRIVACGMHLQQSYGYTVREIEQDGFEIAARVKVPAYDTAAGAALGLGEHIVGFVKAYSEVRPDLVLVLGDRVEILAAVLAAAHMGIPVAHDGGGDITTVDNAARHSISHFATICTVATEQAAERLRRMSISAEIHLTGSLAVDGILAHPFASREETLADLGLPPGSRYLLVTFHPEPEHADMAGEWMSNLLRAVGEFGDVVVTYPNSDPGSEAIISVIDRYAGAFRYTVKAFPSLGRTRYLHALKYADALVGNSSSGLYEAPSLCVPVVNVGRRQEGRLMARNVWSCRYEYESIRKALAQVLAPEFRRGLSGLVSPYGDGHAAERMMEIIEKRLGE